VKILFGARLIGSYGFLMGCGECEGERLKGHKFCSDCGTRLAPAGPRPAEGARTERRQLTVLFYDMVGSTELSAALEPEDFRDAIANFHAVAAEAVSPYDAFVAAHLGDGGIVYFGYPLAREDAAECAVLSGLALIDATSRITLPNGKKVRVRVGIATGTVVVGRVEDGDSGNSAVGQVTSLAARLQSRAQPNQCVIASRTLRLVGELFQTEDLGLVDAKGFADGVQAFAVLGRSQQDRLHHLMQAQTALIGREAEKALLDNKWRGVLGGRGEIWLITGEAGVGKSRLALEFSRLPKKVDSFRITCFCKPHSRQSALRPFIAHFRKLAGAWDQRSEPQLDLFEAKLAAKTSELDRHLLARSIGLQRAAPSEVAEMSATQIRAATINAMIRQLALLSQQKPVVMLIEDMHWSDPSTRELLEKVANGGDIGRTMIIMTARPEIGDDWPLAKAFDRIELLPFSAAESRMLIDEILGGKASEAMVRAITERAGGVALFVEELTKSILQADAHVYGEAAKTYDLQSSFDLPETLQDSLLARLDQLGEAKRVAQIASVVGRNFSKRELLQIAPELDELIDRGCEKLCEVGLVVPLSKGTREFQFRHVLIQEIANSTLVRADRRDYNARLLDALEAEAQGVQRADAERWAQYAWEAGRPQRSVHYWLVAGAEALRVFAMKEAEAQLRHGLDLIDKVDAPDERARLELDLLLTLGKVLMAQVGHANPETGQTFDRAKVLAEHIGDTSKLLAAMHGQQAFDLQLSRMRASRDRSNDMLMIAEQRNDDAWKVIGLRSRGISSFALGEYAQSADDLLSGIALVRKTGPAVARGIVADDLLAAMEIYASWSLVYLGETERGMALSYAACDRAELIRQPYTRAFAYVGRNYCKMLTKDLDGLQQGLEECIALCEENEILYFLFTEKIHMAQVASMQGRPGAAAQIRAAIEDYRQTRSILYQPTYKHWEAVAWLAEGDDKAAREANQWSIATAESHDMHHMLGEYYGLKAVLDYRASDERAALRSVEIAQGWVERQKARLAGQLNRELWDKYGLTVGLASRTDGLVPDKMGL
jgi:class 3 adenylate cyclase